MKKPQTIKLNQDTLRKLKRLKELKAVAQVHEEIDDEELEELRDAQSSLVETFLPVVHLLAQSGLLTPFVDLKGEDISEYTDILADSMSATENGNIQINCDLSGGCCKGPSVPKTPTELQ